MFGRIDSLKLAAALLYLAWLIGIAIYQSGG
jgi:hypothetical protein